MARSAISFIFVLLTQFSLFLIPLFFSSFSLFIQLALSALLLLLISGIGKFSRRRLQVHASAPAFVFFNLIFIWVFYFTVIRKAVAPLKDIAFNGELAVLLIGLFSILSMDPGSVKHGSASSDNFAESSVSQVETTSEPSISEFCSRHSFEEGPLSVRRVRYCKICKAFVRGFDHHCPAFGNCIGEKNHLLFFVLLLGFITTEASYITSAYQFAGKFQTMVDDSWKVNLEGNLAMSTMLFSLLQVLWQVVFLAWHIYCICFNIKTDEWINWKRYPEFQLVHHGQDGQPPEIKFKNPYDKGIFRNLKEFLFKHD
ncbi:hypothetical protein Ancab_007275 [Ancistrocladus abbreviatus]